jgi:protein-tyrosine phosphatase
VLTEHGYDASRHRARQFDAGWFESCDLILVMDAQNHRDVTAIGSGSRVRMFRDYDPAGPGDVPDPYFGRDDGFAEVLSMVERTADALVAELRHPAAVEGRNGS